MQCGNTSLMEISEDLFSESLTLAVVLCHIKIMLLCFLAIFKGPGRKLGNLGKLRSLGKFFPAFSLTTFRF